MNMRPIRCDTDYDAALETIDSLMGAAPDTPEEGIGLKFSSCLSRPTRHVAGQWKRPTRSQ